MKYCVLIPAYQPDEKLIVLCKKLCGEKMTAYVRRVIIVDDGSGSAYAGIFHQACSAGAVLLGHAENKGKGAAIKTGLMYIQEHLPDYHVVTADADGQHELSDIEKIAGAIEKHPSTLVLGVRDFSKMPLRSKAGNTITRFFYKIITGISITDTQTGLRGFSCEMLNKLLTVEGERYEYEMNTLLQLRTMGFHYIEIPIRTIYLENNKSSHFHTVRDGVMVFSRVLKYSAASVLSAAVDFLLYWLFSQRFTVSLSYVFARMISALMNYELNLHGVFKSRFTMKSLAGYAILCVSCMVLGAYAVKLLCACGIHKLAAKPLVDAILFIMNYYVQKNIIFKDK